LPTDRALVNRLGLGNEGAAAIARRIGGMRRPPGFPIGINVVKTHDPAIIGAEGLDDFACAARTMLPHADFLVLNVSCPNTAEGKTFEDPASLAELLDRVMAERAALRSEVPVLVKLSPPAPLDAEGAFDTSALDELMDLALERGVAGFVATNTASDRAGLSTPTARLEAIGHGGLSGAPIRARALAMTRHRRRRLEGRAAIVGVGGIDTPEAAYERICAGADLVELYTGLVYAGPGLVGEAARTIVRGLDRDGHGSVADAVGSCA
ncbi:MAG: quinone-dependent dihydroorotate dehydrogenase, partial [Planctomycetota bacterium]|nr:quinone-dependent dihydroorotate dehydrogenase [Planctomycetota bacterium]